MLTAILVVLSWSAGILSALAFYCCPSLDSFLTLVTGTPLASELPIDFRIQVPIAQQICHALLQARAATVLEQRWYAVVRTVSLGYGITFYGIFKRWGACGNYRHVFASFRDRAPLIDLYLDDDEIQRTIAHEWRAAEQALVNQQADQSLHTFQRIARRLQSNPSPVAHVDAALAHVMAWQAAEQLGERVPDTVDWSLLELSELVQRVPHQRLRRFLQITVADLLTERGHDMLETYQQLARETWWPYDETYYHSITQAAWLCSARGEYETAAAYTARALQYYKNQLDADMALVGRLVLVRCIALMALSRWDAWLGERALVEFFGKSSPELVFVGRLYNAWSRLDTGMYELAFRDFDRERAVDDQDVRIIARGKARIKELQGMF